MLSRGAVSCAVALIAGCSSPADPPFLDKGRAVWVEMPGAPPMTYHAVWGADASFVLAAGDAGVAHWDGEVWRPVEGVPATTYRAVWGRSASEVWIGGDGALVARLLTGWQLQHLYDGDHPITDYSVVALGGDSLREYAIVLTGGKLLLLVNRGSFWKTPLWRGASGPTWPFPRQPSLIVHGGQLLLAGDGDLVMSYTSSDLGVPMWDAYRWRAGVDVPPVSSISGGPHFWVAAGAADIAIHRDEDYELELASDRRVAPRPPGAGGLFASRPNRFFIVGEPIAAGGTASPVEACDEDGCELERVEAGGGQTPLRAVWGDEGEMVIAAGDGIIVERTSCGGRRCRLP